MDKQMAYILIRKSSYTLTWHKTNVKLQIVRFLSKKDNEKNQKQPNEFLFHLQF